VEGIRNFDDVVVIAGQGVTAPGFLDGGQDRATVALDAKIWCNIRMAGVVGVAENATVALVPEIAVKATVSDTWIPLTDVIASLICDELPHVGTYIPTS
jgi:hypothetical protein